MRRLAFAVLGVLACVGDSSSAPDGAVPDAGDASIAETGCEGGCGVVAVKDVVAGGAHACALLVDGTVACWGRNDLGQTGTAPSPQDQTCGTTDCRPSPTLIPSLSGVVQVCLGDDYGCSVDKTGNVACWGNNGRSQLAQPYPNTSYSATPLPVPMPMNLKVNRVSCGASVVCAHTVTNQLFCWGDNRSHVINGSGGSITTPTEIVITSDAGVVVPVDVALAPRPALVHACALASGGGVWCWGPNDVDQLGHAAGTSGDTTACANGATMYECNPTPTLVASLPSATAIAVGNAASCAIAGGSLYCWGLVSYDLLGTSDAGPSFVTTPTMVANLPSTLGVVRVGPPAQQAAIDGAGKLWMWGINADGELGNGNTNGTTCSAASGPYCVTPTVSSTTVTTIAMGYQFSVALLPDGGVLGWGLNTAAQLGHMTNTGGDVACYSATCNPTPELVGGIP